MFCANTPKIKLAYIDYTNIHSVGFHEIDGLLLSQTLMIFIGTAPSHFGMFVFAMNYTCYCSQLLIRSVFAFEGLLRYVSYFCLLLSANFRLRCSPFKALPLSPGAWTIAEIAPEHAGTCGCMKPAVLSYTICPFWSQGNRTELQNPSANGTACHSKSERPVLRHQKQQWEVLKVT